MSTINGISLASTSGTGQLVPSLAERDEPDNRTHKALSKADRQEQLSEAIKKIKTFLTTFDGSNLKLRLGHGLIYSKKLTQLLDEAKARYYFESDTLVVRGKGPVHGSLSEFAFWSIGQLQKEILTPEESRHVAMNASKVQLYGKKLQPYVKVPDQAYVLTDPQTGMRYRTVIFEAAFSESYDDLLRDMQQWLLHSDSDNQVQLVVLANIKEDKKIMAMRQKSDAFRDRAARLLKDFGNSLGRTKHAHLLVQPTEACAQQESQATEIDESQPHVGGICTRIQGQVQPSDWVGPITAELEFWELQGQEPQRRGQIVRVFPGPASGDLPPLYVGDVIHPDLSRQLFKLRCISETYFKP